MEMADAIIINKADGDNVAKAKLAKTEFNRALHLFPTKKSQWTPTVSTCSAYEKTGIEDVWETITKYINLVKHNGYFEENRRNQNQFWMMETINEQLKLDFYNHKQVVALLEQNKKALQNNEISPFAAALNLLDAYYSK
jgi:LAO/AO transport system kinase